MRLAPYISPAQAATLSADQANSQVSPDPKFVDCCIQLWTYVGLNCYTLLQSLPSLTGLGVQTLVKKILQYIELG